jgi:TPR repeat protein
MYEEGKGVKQDDFKALKFFQKACDLNDLFNAFASAIQIPKKRATTARIQITRLLVKLERLILAVVALFLGICMAEAKALNKMISRRSSFTKRRVI